MTSKEVANLLQVSRSAVQRWVDAGELRAFKTPGGHRRITARELVAFLRRLGMPVPPVLDRQLRLLVIDPQPGYVKALRATLATARPRVEVEIAEEPLRALIAIGARRPDLVLLDASVAGFNGLGAVKAIKTVTETSEMHVVAIADPKGDGVAKLRAAGASEVLARPVDVAQVVETLMSLGLLDEPPIAA